MNNKLGYDESSNAFFVVVVIGQRFHFEAAEQFFYFTSPQGFPSIGEW